MIIERNEFRIKFGKMREALALWKQIFEVFSSEKDAPKVRILTDLTGPAYTLIVEISIRSMQDIGFKTYKWMTNEKVAELYQQLVPLCESSTRVLYNIEYEN